MIKPKETFVYDIETLRTYFCIVFKSTTNEQFYSFEISNRKNQLQDLYDFLNNNVAGLIGFNNLFFDYPVLHYILENYKYLQSKNSRQIIDDLYNLAQDVIRCGNSNDFNLKFKYSIPEWKLKIPQLDLFKIWHYDNKAKMTSLKKIQFAIRWNNVQDMPYNHDDYIYSNEEYDEILEYCHNDVDSTYAFYLITRGKTDLPIYKDSDKIKFRLNIKKALGIDCMNFNDVKIGDEINKKNYLKETGLTWNDIKGINTVRNEVHLKDCIAPFIKFKSKQLSEFLEKIKSITVNGTKAEFSEEIIYKGVTFTFGLGGIHSVDKPRIIIVDDDKILEDRDVGSMYPSTLINLKLFPAHLGVSWLNGYMWTYDERFVYKRRSKDQSVSEEVRNEADSFSDGLKLALNGGGYGKTGEKNSWQHDIQVMLTTTITNQLALLMLAEEYLDNNYQVISANTDGIVLYYKKEDKEKIQEIDKKWQEITKYNLEYTQYIKFIQTSVNDYITLKPDGKMKFKGDFEIEKELHKNHSMKIVPMALKEYFINDIPVEKTIMECNDILDFCKAANMIGQNVLNARTLNSFGEIVDVPLSKTTRYYVSNEGCQLIKKMPQLEHKETEFEKLTREGQLSIFDIVPDVLEDVDRETNIESGYFNTLFNVIKYRNKIEDYDINYNYYLDECYKIIGKIEPYKWEENIYENIT